MRVSARFLLEHQLSAVPIVPFADCLPLGGEASQPRRAGVFVSTSWLASVLSGGGGGEDGEEADGAESRSHGLQPELGLLWEAMARERDVKQQGGGAAGEAGNDCILEASSEDLSLLHAALREGRRLALAQSAKSLLLEAFRGTPRRLRGV